MDIRTAILALAVGNCVFGVILILFQARGERLPSNSYWMAAKFLQSAGWVLLFFRGSLPDFFDMTLANTTLIAGFAYECWAMYWISGKSVKMSMEGSSLLVIVLCCAILPFLAPSMREVLVSFLSGVFFILSGRALLSASGPRSPLRMYVGWSVWLLAGVIIGRGFVALAVTEEISLFSNHIVQIITFAALYYTMLTGGFGVMLLAREATDQQLQAVLQEQEAILHTLPSGLCIVRDRIIERCNPAMEDIFGYSPGTLVGKSVRQLFENEFMFQDFGKKIYGDILEKGQFAGEVQYVRKDGERFWASDHGAFIFPERSRTWAVFSITDISKQKKQQETLAAQKVNLENTLARIKRLEGIISICMYCKKIRNEKQSWEQLEKYISQNTDAMFSHAVCPECYEKQYGSVKSVSDRPHKSGPF